MTWTQFWDMHSGGGLKEPPYHFIYIEAPEDEATTIFYNRFGHNPNRVTCTCCGEDYSVMESPTLEEATAYHRGCSQKKHEDGTWEWVEEKRRVSWVHEYLTTDDYVATTTAATECLFIHQAEIKDGERV